LYTYDKEAHELKVRVQELELGSELNEHEIE